MNEENSPERERSYSCCGSNSALEQHKRDSSVKQDEGTRKIIRKQYAEIAKQKNPLSENLISSSSEYTTYTEEELQTLPEGANLGLGSGNPVALANIQFGEVVVDLGSGAGIDCFLAAQKTGETGRVIGIDMTAEMIAKARNNAQTNNVNNVEFRLGEIEHLPVADSSVDVIVSNCVINLALDKSQVFKEAMRILKPGGRLVISDIVLEEEFPEVVKKALANAPGCVSRAWVTHDYLAVIEEAGFEEVEMIETEVIRPRKEMERQASGKVKGRIISDGKEVEVDLSEEEAASLATIIMKAHIKAKKPQTTEEIQH